MSNTTIVDKNTAKCASNMDLAVSDMSNVLANNNIFDSNIDVFLKNVKFCINF